MKDSFVFHFDWVDDLPDEYKEPFTLHAVKYAMHGIEPNVTGLERTVWLKIKRQIDDDTARYEDKCAKRSAAGKKGGRPKKAEEAAEGTTAPVLISAQTQEEEKQETETTAQPVKAVIENVQPVSAQSVTTAQEQTAEEEPQTQAATASELWCVENGYIFDQDTYQRFEARSNGLDVPAYLAFCLQKVKAQYPLKNGEELRLLFRNALLTWDNLRFEFRQHLEMENAKAQAEKDAKAQEEAKPKTCPECGKPLDFANSAAPSCKCGFYSLEGGVWTWNKKADTIPLSAKAFMKSYGLKPAAQMPPPQRQAAGAEQFDIF